MSSCQHVHTRICSYERVTGIGAVGSFGGGCAESGERANLANDRASADACKERLGLMDMREQEPLNAQAAWLPCLWQGQVGVVDHTFGTKL